jgi:hypothetical protein
MGQAVCYISFVEVEESFVKTNLLADQSIYVHWMLQECLGALEKDVEMMKTPASGDIKMFKIDKKEVLKKLIRVFINFSFIKNVFEIDSDDFNLEYQCFTLKDSLIYCMNFLMSSYPDAKINLKLDPTLPRDVEGDVVKFHQIMISLMDFALKSSRNVNVDTTSDYDMKLGGFIVHFEISFNSSIIFNESDLQMIFSQQEEYFIQSVKNYKSLGLALNLTARLLTNIKGSFDKWSQDSAGRMVLKFEIPFKMADFSNNPYVEIPSLSALLQPSCEDFTMQKMSTIDKGIQISEFQNNQESGNENSFGHVSKETLKNSWDNIRGSLANNAPISEKENNQYSSTGNFSIRHPLEDKSTFRIEEQRLAKTQFTNSGLPKSPEMRLKLNKHEKEAGSLFSSSKSSEKSQKEEIKGKTNRSNLIEISQQKEKMKHQLAGIIEEIQEYSQYEKNEPFVESAKQQTEKRIEMKQLKMNETEEQFDKSLLEKHGYRLLSMKDIPSKVEENESKNMKIDLSVINK